MLVALAPPDRRGAPGDADVTLTVATTRWEGLGSGHGHRRARRVEVVAGGRREADRPRRIELWLPSPDPAVPSAPSARVGPDTDTHTDTAGGALAPVVPHTRRRSG